MERENSYTPLNPLSCRHAAMTIRRPPRWAWLRPSPKLRAWQPVVDTYDMVTIVSPSTNSRILRTLITAGVVAGFSVWFLYDGYIGYPRANIAKAVESLNPVPDDIPRIDSAVTERLAEELTAELHDRRLRREQVYERLGEPAWLNETGDTARYFGPGGMLGLSFDGEMVADLFFHPGAKDDLELMWQKLLGLGFLPVGLILIFRTIRVLTIKFVLDDRGLSLGGSGVIPFDAMTGLGGDMFSRRGYVDLHYSVNGRPRRARLDEYVIRDHRAIVTEICARRRFENPLRSPRETERSGTP